MGRTDSVTSRLRPACWQVVTVSPTPGICRASRVLMSSFSAHTCASSTSDWRKALRVSALVACPPASSEIATIASATSTSISVKPAGRVVMAFAR